MTDRVVKILFPFIIFVVVQFDRKSPSSVGPLNILPAKKVTLHKQGFNRKSSTDIEPI